jgi:hypothetical protein
MVGALTLIALVLCSYWSGIGVVQDSTVWGNVYGTLPQRVYELMDVALGWFILRCVAESGVEWVLQSAVVFIVLDQSLKAFAGSECRALMIMKSLLHPKYVLAVVVGITSFSLTSRLALRLYWMDLRPFMHCGAGVPFALGSVFFAFYAYRLWALPVGWKPVRELENDCSC